MNIQNFMDMLPFMGKGMAGIFIVTLVLMGFIAVFNLVFSKTK